MCDWPCSAHQKCYKICATYTSTSLLLDFLISVQRNAERLLNHTLQNVAGFLRTPKRRSTVWCCLPEMAGHCRNWLTVARVLKQYERPVVAFSCRSRYSVNSEILSSVSLFRYVQCLIVWLILKQTSTSSTDFNKILQYNVSRKPGHVVACGEDRQTDRQTWIN
jgi:hypothetical protein